MKKIFFGTMICMIIVSLVVGTTNCSDNKTKTVNGVTTSEVSGCNLDIPALTQLVKSSSSASDVENKLNQPNSINNVDLDKDGQVDFIKVTESVDDGGNKVLVFYDVQKTGDVQLVTMSFNKTTNYVNAVGDPDYYGYNNEYRSMLTDFLILNYLFAPHPYYVSPYYYGHYYGSYRGYRTVSRTTYYKSPSVSTANANRSITNVPHSATSPSKTPMIQQRSLNGQTTFQKSFSNRDAKQKVNAVGFKNSPASSSSSKSSGFSSGSKSSSSSSSRSSGFGSSSSRSSSWGSSSSSSRSSSWGSSSSRSSGFSSSRSGRR
jgi:hypothetical protein